MVPRYGLSTLQPSSAPISLSRISTWRAANPLGSVVTAAASGPNERSNGSPQSSTVDGARVAVPLVELDLVRPGADVERDALLEWPIEADHQSDATLGTHELVGVARGSPRRRRVIVGQRSGGEVVVLLEVALGIEGGHRHDAGGVAVEHRVRPCRSRRRAPGRRAAVSSAVPSSVVRGTAAAAVDAVGEHGRGRTGLTVTGRQRPPQEECDDDGHGDQATDDGRRWTPRLGHARAPGRRAVGRPAGCDHGGPVVGRRRG